MGRLEGWDSGKRGSFLPREIALLSMCCGDRRSRLKRRRSVWDSTRWTRKEKKYLNRGSCLRRKYPKLSVGDMEVLAEGKNFRLVHEDELTNILEVLEKYLPYSLKFHQTILTYMRDRVWDFHFYVSKGWPEEPLILHFPGMTFTPKNKLYESFSIFCPTERKDLLYQLENEDVLIDWSEPVYLNYTHEEIVDAISHFETVDHADKVPSHIYVQSNPPPEPLVLEDLQSEEFEVRELEPKHAQEIHELYPANDMECVEVFERLIKRLPACGVFFEGRLAAWMMQSYYGAMFSMQTRPEFRRKGLGIHLAQALTVKVRSRKYTPFVTIRPENDASLSLYSKLGFTKSYPTARATFYPKANASRETWGVGEEKVENGKDEQDSE